MLQQFNRGVMNQRDHKKYFNFTFILYKQTFVQKGQSFFFHKMFFDFEITAC